MNSKFELSESGYKITDEEDSSKWIKLTGYGFECPKEIFTNEQWEDIDNRIRNSIRKYCFK